MSELMSANDYRRTTDGDVLRLYRAFFDREPDVAGARYWLNVRRNYSLIQISQFFAASEEYRIRYSGTDDREFLRRVYANVLGRSFDQSGFDYWLDVLRGTNASGQNPARGRASRGEVVRWVTASKEFTTNYPY